MHIFIALVAMAFASDKEAVTFDLAIGLKLDSQVFERRIEKSQAEKLSRGYCSRVGLDRSGKSIKPAKLKETLALNAELLACDLVTTLARGTPIVGPSRFSDDLRDFLELQDAASLFGSQFKPGPSDRVTVVSQGKELVVSILTHKSDFKKGAIHRFTVVARGTFNEFNDPSTNDQILAIRRTSTVPATHDSCAAEQFHWAPRSGPERSGKVKLHRASVSRRC